MKNNFLDAFLRMGGCLTVLSLFLAAEQAHGMDEIVIQRQGHSHKLQGEIVVEAQDGGLMFRADDGQIWMIQPDEIQSQSKNEQPFRSINNRQFGEKLLKRVPASQRKFRVIKSSDYVIVCNTSPVFANWVKSLTLRLNVAFRNFWKNQGVKLRQPDVPLGILIFASKKEFDEYSVATLGSVQGNALAYYNLQSNLVVMYDLTGTEQLRGNQRITNSQQLQQVLLRPEAAALVATIVHESVHQISYNSGLQERFGPFPFWLNEGLAMFFEVPDLGSRRGWNAIGKVNPPRLSQLKKKIAAGSKDVFEGIIHGDESFRDPDQIMDSYAESWALNYYFLKQKPKEYIRYLQRLGNDAPLTEIDKEDRIKLFEETFGPVEQVRIDCLRYLMRL